MELIFPKETESGKYIPVLILIVLKHSLMQSPFVPNNNHKKRQRDACPLVSRHIYIHMHYEDKNHVNFIFFTDLVALIDSTVLLLS